MTLPSPTNAETALSLEGVGVERSGHHIVSGVDLDVAPGSFLGILGPNGSGKTTLLRVLTGAIPPSSGTVRVLGREVAAYGRQELARTVGVVPQNFSLDFKFTVEEVVALGRFPHWRGWGSRQEEDLAPVHSALANLSITHLADRSVTDLSGGERQRVLIAQSLAQNTPILLLDEPLNNLDINHQLQVMELLTRLNSEGQTVVVVLHDINVAAQYCAELCFLSRGRLVSRGRPETVVDPELIFDVFETRVTVHRQGRRPYITPVSGGAGAQAAGANRYRVHIITGGGAATTLIEELAHRGFTPSIGVVSVFDSDYQVAQRLGLPLVSAPPFEPLTAAAVTEHRAMVAAADCIVVAPQAFGRGNLANLEVPAEVLPTAKPVLVISSPAIEQRDLTGGQAAALQRRLFALGAIDLPDTERAVEAICALAAETAA